MEEPPDSKVNEWHFDLDELAGSKLVDLAKAMRDKGEFDRVSRGKISKLLSDGLKKGEIDKEKLPEESRLIEKLDEMGLLP